MILVNNNKPYYDFTTKNESFIKVHKALKDAGINNNKFMLTIFNSDLIGVDPSDPNLDLIVKKNIMEECMTNYWYYIREVIRLPIQGNNTIRYIADRSNIAQSWCSLLLDIDTWTTKPRQIMLTTSTMVLLSWILLFGKSSMEMNINSRLIDESVFRNIKLKKIIQSLPSYLQIINVSKEFPREILNVMAANAVRAKSLYNYNDSIFDANYSYVDDAAFQKNIELIVYRSKKYSDENHTRIFTSIRNAYGRSIEEPVILASKRWNEEMYDLYPKFLKDEVNKTETGLMYIEHNYKDLWKTDEWVEGQKIFFNDENSFNAEVLMKWEEQ